LNLIEPLEGLLQYFLVKEQKGCEGLVLGRGGDVPIDREVREEGSNFRFTHLNRMAFVMKEDEPFHPSEVGLFGSDGVMAKADGVPGLFKQFRHAEPPISG
jgi:hypothetical protein